METKIAILRGINVGGKRKILMKDLKVLCEKLEWKNIKTYIQSGNIIFKSTQKNIDLAHKLQQAIAQQYDFEVPVIVMNVEELKTAIDNNPFYENTAIEQLHLTFLSTLPNTTDIKQIENTDFTPDAFKIKDKNIFIYCEGKYHKSKLTNNFFEKKLKVIATTRNWKTVLKLKDLAQD